jgi:hypothetical protein
VIPHCDNCGAPMQEESDDETGALCKGSASMSANTNEAEHLAQSVELACSLLQGGQATHISLLHLRQIAPLIRAQSAELASLRARLSVLEHLRAACDFAIADMVDGQIRRAGQVGIHNALRHVEEMTAERAKEGETQK